MNIAEKRGLTSLAAGALLLGVLSGCSDDNAAPDIAKEKDGCSRRRRAG